MNAWLVKWVSSSSSKMKQHPIAAVFDGQLPVARVAELVELLYAQDAYTIAERMAFVRHPDDNPYPAEINQLDRGARSFISCGHNPWLEAHLVEDLRVEADDEADTEIITWNQMNADGSLRPQRVVQPRS